MVPQINLPTQLEYYISNHLFINTTMKRIPETRSLLSHISEASVTSMKHTVQQTSNATLTTYTQMCICSYFWT